jgi:thiol-disulfide isomerase/thioredoxin
MNIGHWAIPTAPLILFASVVLAVVAGRLVSRGAPLADAPVMNSVLVALVVSRLSFVGHYLPAYRTDWIKILDIRDQGFDPLPGVVVGAAMLAWVLVRRAHLRRAVAVAALAGVVGWSTATWAASLAAREETLPPVALVDLGGHARTLARTDGKPLVVNLWASWCAPCRSEMPMLTEVQRDLPGIDLALVDQGESAATVADFLAAQGLKSDNVLLDPQMAVALWVNARGFPTTLFYDSRGTLLAVHLGPFSRATFQHAIETLYPALPGLAQASGQ